MKLVAGEVEVEIILAALEMRFCPRSHERLVISRWPIRNRPPAVKPPNLVDLRADDNHRFAAACMRHGKRRWSHNRFSSKRGANPLLGIGGQAL